MKLFIRNAEVQHNQTPRSSGMPFFRKWGTRLLLAGALLVPQTFGVLLPNTVNAQFFGECSKVNTPSDKQDNKSPFDLAQEHKEFKDFTWSFRWEGIHTDKKKCGELELGLTPLIDDLRTDFWNNHIEGPSGDGGPGRNFYRLHDFVVYVTEEKTNPIILKFRQYKKMMCDCKKKMEEEQKKKNEEMEKKENTSDPVTEEKKKMDVTQKGTDAAVTNIEEVKKDEKPLLQGHVLWAVSIGIAVLIGLCIYGLIRIKYNSLRDFFDDLTESAPQDTHIKNSHFFGRGGPNGLKE